MRVSGRSRREFFRITRVVKKFDRASRRLVISIGYKTASDITPRTLAVAEAFGLGIDKNRTRILYDNVELKIGAGDIVYITGDSGSGKSVLLRRLERLLKPQTINIKNVPVDARKPIIDTVGKTFHEGLTLLSRVGLNDAFLFIRRYNELSDGQKYRYKIAKLVEATDKQFWVMDEFCSLLDRETAKTVAYNVQKLARQMGKTVLAATTHTDLLEDLQPDVHVHKGLGKKVKVNYCPHKQTGANTTCACTLQQTMRIHEGTVKDYEKLAEYHYRTTEGSRLPPPRRIFKIVNLPAQEPVGVIVYSYPPLMCFGRKQAMKKQKPTIKELNSTLSNISRVVLHPKYRSIGLGAWLVKETLNRAGTPYVETVAVMAKYNPFFEKAGMQKTAEQKPAPECVKAIEKLQELGFNPVMLASVEYNRKTLKHLNTQQCETAKAALASVAHPRLRRAFQPNQLYMNNETYAKLLETASTEKLAKALQVLAILTQTKTYLFWQKPLQASVEAKP